MNTITITKHESGQEVGYICWYSPDEYDVEYIITVLHVHDLFRGRGYGTLLIKSMLIKIESNLSITIKLDDCSDFTGQCNNIYYKLGFRNLDDTQQEVMTIYIESVFDFVNQIKIKDFDSVLFEHNIEKDVTILIKNRCEYKC